MEAPGPGGAGLNIQPRRLGRGRPSPVPLPQKVEVAPSPGDGAEIKKPSRGFGRGKPVGLPERYQPRPKIITQSEERLEKGDGDSALDLKPQPALHHKYHYSRVVHPPPINAFKGDQFIITGWDGFNWVYITPRKCLSERKMDISDEILEWVAVNDKTGWVDGPPSDIQVGRVILAINTQVKPHKYFRGFVKRLDVTENVVEVENLDSGTSHFTNVVNIRELSDNIMQVPILGHKVALNSVDFSKHLILPYQFKMFMKRKMSSVFCLSDVTPEGKVELREKSSKMTLAEEINGLEKWPWEKYLEMVGSRAVTDSEIIELYSGSKYLEDSVQCLDLPQEEDIDVRIKSFSMESENGRVVTPILVVEPLHQVTDELRKVMDTQVERYMARVKPSICYPKREEIFFLRPPGEELSRRWHRCIRIALKVGYYYCIDEDTKICDLNEEYETRSLPVDFRVIPRLTVDTQIKGLEWESTTSVGKNMDIAFREFFRVSDIIKVRFSSEYSPLSRLVQCTDFEKIMNKIKSEETKTKP